jgi:heme-degrading monooxygenase HmoA
LPTNEYPTGDEQSAARVVRVWKGRGTADGVARYCGDHFRERVLPQLRALDGFLGARLLVRRAGDDEHEVVVMTTWASLDAVKAFAGEDYGRAVVEPVVHELLHQVDDEVAHFTVAREA